MSDSIQGLRLYGLPLDHVTLTAAELREAVDEANNLFEETAVGGDRMATNAAAATLNSVLTYVDETLGDDAPDSVEPVPEGTVDITNPLQREGLFATIALSAVTTLRQVNGGDTETSNALIKRTERPRQKEEKERQRLEKLQRQEEQAQRAAAEISTIEEKYSVRASDLRGFSYPVEKGTKNGTFLMRSILEKVRSREGMTVFQDVEARALVGLIVRSTSKAAPSDFYTELRLEAARLTSLEAVRVRAANGANRSQHGLRSALQKLTELYEAGVIGGSQEIKPLHDFCHHYFEMSDDELQQEYIDRMDLGELEEAEELWIVPFSPRENSDETIDPIAEGTAEIDPEDFTGDNIEEDISAAVQHTRTPGIYRVERQRIDSFLAVLENLRRHYGAGAEIKLHRTLHKKWHPLPWYAIEVIEPGKEPYAILEIPIYGNATHIVKSGEYPWRDVIRHTNRIQARAFGSVPVLHEYDEVSQELIGHDDAVKDKLGIPK